MQRRANRSLENQDDADDDLSDEIDEYSAAAFDSDNENDEDTDIENRGVQQRRSSDNEDMNSNETESIDELQDLNNSDNEGIDEDNEDDGDGNEGNESNLSGDRDGDELEGHDSRNSRKSKGFAKSYESCNEENSESEVTGKAKNKRIKSLLHQQQPKMKSKSASSNSGNQQHGVEFPAESEPIYCVCSEISYGQMICCDNDSCKIEWFHFECVKLHSKPKGKWYCPNCRGDSHKVMRKFTEPANSTSYSSSYRIK
jgi:hypothetical protein